MSNITDRFWSGVSHAKHMWTEATTPPDFRFTEDLADFVYSMFKLIGGEICEKAILLPKYYMLNVKVFQLPQNFAALFWTERPSFNFFTMNMQVVKDVVKDESVIEELTINEDNHYYSYKSEAEFKKYLNEKFEKNGVDKKDAINNAKFALVPGDDRLHVIASKCFAFANIVIPTAWAVDVGLFNPAVDALGYVSRSLGGERVFSFMGRMTLPKPLVNVVSFEKVIVGAFTLGFAIKTWLFVKAYFAANDDQKAHLRNSWINSGLLASLCAADLVGGSTRFIAPIATFFNLYHLVSKFKTVTPPVLTSV